MKKQTGPVTQCNFRLQPRILAIIDKLAEKDGVTRTAVISRLVSEYGGLKRIEKRLDDIIKTLEG